MNARIKVKFISKNPIQTFHFTKLAPPNEQIDYCFDPHARDYDCLVVYDDLPKKPKQRLSNNEERLACARARTILLTYEPASIKFYGTDYIRQFGRLLTSHTPKDLPHPHRFDMPPVGRWYYGDENNIVSPKQLPQKTHNLSLFMSNKTGAHSLHGLRYNFLFQLKDMLKEDIAIFGWDYKRVDKKAAGLDEYCYSIAVENHIGPHHWTEKLSDCFLGYCLPFYDGCTNAEDYFPPESFIRIDMRDAEAACDIIKKAITNKAYEKRLPALIEARRRVIEEHSLPAFLDRHITQLMQETTHSNPMKNEVIYSRIRILQKKPTAALRFFIENNARKGQYRTYWRDYIAGRDKCGL